MKKILFIPLLFMACKKKVTQPEEPARPEPKPGYYFKYREYYPVVDAGVGSSDSVQFLCVSNGKVLLDNKLKIAGSPAPLNFTGVDSVKSGDIVECTTTAYLKIPSATICTFKTDSTWLLNKSSFKKLVGPETFTAPVTYTNNRAIVIFKRKYTI